MDFLLGHDVYEFEEIPEGFVITFPDGTVRTLVVLLNEFQTPVYCFTESFQDCEEIATILGEFIMGNPTPDNLGLQMSSEEFLEVVNNILVANI
jgi:hypothetical protein